MASSRPPYFPRRGVASLTAAALSFAVALGASEAAAADTAWMRALDAAERAAEAAPGDAALPLWQETLRILNEPSGEASHAIPDQTLRRTRILEALITAALAASRRSDETAPLAAATDAADRLQTPEAQAWAMRDIAAAWIERGDDARGLNLLRRADGRANDIADATIQTLARFGLATMALRAGDAGRIMAEAIILRMRAMARRADAATALARAQLAAAGAAELDRDALLARAAADLEAGALVDAARSAAAAPAAGRANQDARSALVERAARGLAAAGDVRAARLALLAIDDADLHGEIAEDLVEAALRAGRLADAEALARSIADHGSSLKAWARIGAALAAKGYDAQADAALARVAEAASHSGSADDMARAAEAFAAYGDIAAARAYLGDATAAGAAKDRTDKAAATLARRLASQGRIAAGMELTESVQDDGQRDRAFEAIAKAQAEAGDAQAARTTAARIKDASRRDRTLREVGKRLSERGALDPALKLVAGIETGDSAKHAEIVHALAATEFERAREIADRIGDGLAKDRAMAAIGAALREAGALYEAMQTVRTIADARIRVAAFRQMAVAQARDLDSYGLLDRKPGDPTASPPSPPPLTAPQRARAATDGPYIAAPVGNRRLGAAMPPLPAKLIDAAELKAGMPPTKPGRLSLALMGYSDWNRKFVASRLDQRAFRRMQRRRYPEYLFIEDGVFDLASLNDAVIGLGERLGQPPILTRKDGAYLLRRPLLIGPGAGLVLRDGETLRLSRDAGAFLVNAGALWAMDADIVAWDEAADAPAFAAYEDRARFRPFLITWSGGVFNGAGARFVALGYGNAKAYGVTFSSGPTARFKDRDEEAARPRGAIVDSAFENMFYAVYSFESDGIQLIGNELRDNIVYGLDPHDRSNRLVIAFNTAYGTQRKHGIIISREVDRSWLFGNVAFDNAGTGIMIDRNSAAAHVYANTVIGNGDNGIAVFESACGVIAANLAAANDRIGVKIRNSRDIGLYANRIARNGAAGIEAYISDLSQDESHGHRDFELDPYQPVTTLSVAGNRIEANRVGIAFIGVNAAYFGRNLWVGQTPRLFSGALGAIGPALAAAGDAGGDIGVANRCAAKLQPYACPFKQSGHLPDDALMAKSGLVEAGRCAPEIVRSETQEYDAAEDDEAPTRRRGPPRASAFRIDEAVGERRIRVTEPTLEARQ